MPVPASVHSRRVKKKPSDKLEAAAPANPLTVPTSATEAEAVGVTSALTRLLQILDFFSLEKTSLRVDDVVEGFDIVQSTAYRYLRELCDAGLLAQQGKGVYSLGRRIVELERILQLSDPLLLAGRAITDELTEHCVNRAFLLCTSYKDGALCIYKIGPDTIQFRGVPMQIQRGRGTLLPLFRGAGSLAILAHMAPHQVKSLFLQNAKEISASGLGDTWKEFRTALADIRRASFAETIGRMNPGMHSIAVPIANGDAKVAGSLLMLGSASKNEMVRARALVPLLREKAVRMAQALAKPDAVAGA